MPDKNDVRGKSQGQDHTGVVDAAASAIPADLSLDEVLNKSEAEVQAEGSQEGAQAEVGNQNSPQSPAGEDALQGELDIDLTQSLGQAGAETSDEDPSGVEVDQGNQEQDQIQATEAEGEEVQEAEEETQVDTSKLTDSGTFTQDIGDQGAVDIQEFITARNEASDFSAVESSLDRLLETHGSLTAESSADNAREINQDLLDALRHLREAIREYQDAYQNLMSEQGDVAEAQAALDALRSQLVELFTEFQELLGISAQDIQDFANGDNSVLADILQAIQDAVDAHTADIGGEQAEVDAAQDAVDQEQLEMNQETSDLATAQGELDTAQGVVDNAQAAVNQEAADVTQAQADLANAQQGVADAQGVVDQETADLATAQGGLANAQGDVTNAQNTVTQETNDLNQAQADLATAQTATTNAQNAVTQETTDLATAQTNLANAQTVITTAQDAVAQASSDLAAAEADLANSQSSTAYSDAQAAVDQATSDLDSETQDLADVQSDLNQEQVELDLATMALNVALSTGNQSLIDPAQAVYDTQLQQRDDAQSDLDAQQADVDQATADLASAQATMDGLQTSMDGAEAAVNQASADLASAQADLSTAETNEVQAQNDVNNAQQDLAVAQINLTNAQNAEAQEQADLTQAQQDLTDAQGALSTAQTTETQAQADVTQAQSDLSDAQDALTAAQATEAQEQADLTQAQADLASAQTTLTSAEDALAQEQGEFDVASQEFSDAQAELATAQAALAAEQQDLAGESQESSTAQQLQNQINDLIDQFNDAQTNLDQQLLELQEAQDALDAAQEVIDFYEDQIAQLNTNDSPLVNDILDQLATEDAGFNFDAGSYFGDADVGDELTFALGPDAPSWMSIDPATGIITGTPGNDDVGVTNVTVFGTDLEGASGFDTFQVNVENTNDAPTMTPIGDTALNQDVGMNYDVSGQFSDMDSGDSFTYSLAPGAPAWVSINSATGVLTGTPGNDDLGTASITVVATDSGGESVQDTFDVTVNNVNDAPTVTPISDTSVSEDAGLNYDVSGQFSDIDTGDTMTFSLAPGAPAWMSIDTNTGIITGTPLNADVGTSSITVIATDGSGETAQDTFDVTVNNTNDAPTVTPIGDTAVSEDAALSYDVSGQFADMDVGDTLTYSLAPGAPAWVSIDANTGEITGTPANGDVGTSSITVIADDGNGGTVQDSFDITVNNTNDAPTVTPISDTAVSEDAALSYDVSGQFADMDVGDTLTYSLAPGAPAWVSIDGNTGEITGTPTNDDLGTSSITVIADDGNGGGVQDTFDITVNNTNDAPTVTPISDTSVNEDAALNYDVSGQFADADVGDSMTYSLAPGAPAWVSINSITGVLMGIPGNDDVGTSSITVIATDGSGATEQDTFDVTVNNVNDVPTVTPISDTAVSEDATMNYDVSGQFADDDTIHGDSLTYTLGAGSPAWVSIDGNTGVLTGTPDNGDVGTSSITVIATDGSGSTVQDTFDVTVNNTNDAPTVTPISDVGANEDSALSYDVSGNFADSDLGDTLTFSLAPGAPAWVSIDANTGEITGTPTNDDVGVNSITVIADDGNGGAVQDSFDITVNNTNDAPTVTPISDTAVSEDATMNYDVSGQFADDDTIHGDSLTYTLSPGAPAWMSIDANTGVLTGTPTNDDLGTSSITVTATDDSGVSVQDTFDVTVNNTNDAPTVTPISDTAVNEDAGLNYDVSGQFADVDVSDTLTYSLAPGAPAWVSIDVNTGVLTGTPLNADVGVNTITVIADDGNGGTVQDTFDVTVNNVNDAPTVTPISDTAVSEDAALSYDVSGQFADDDTIHGDSLTYSLAPGAPAWVAINAATGELTGTPTNDDVGVNTVTVIATDGSGETAQDTFDITVNNTNDAPTVTPISDTSVNEDVALNYDVSGQFADSDVGDTLTYSLAPGAPAWVSIDVNTGVLTGTPDNGDVGTSSITVIADDGNGGTVQDTFDVTVNNTNDAPTVTPISDTAVSEDAALSYDVSGNFADDDTIHGDSLIYTLAPGAPAWVAINAATGELTGTPTNDDVGTSSITVIATDGSGETAQDTFDITVNNTNDAPTVTPISDTSVNEDVGMNYDVSGQFADSDVGDTLTYSLAPGAPAWVSIDANSGEITGTPTNDDVGVNTVTVIATDGSGSQVSDSFDITVNNTNDAPTVTPISDTAVSEDATMNYDVSGQFADVDVGDTLSYSLAPGAPAWMSIDSNTGIISGTPTNDDLGTSSITVIADDGNGGTIQDTFDVTVNNTNDAPTVTPISDTSLNEDTGLNYDVSGQFADVDVGDTLTFSLAPGAPAWVSIDVNTGVLTGTPDNGDVGTSSITVIADDGNGGTVQDTFDVTVNNVNDAPTVTPISDTAVNEDVALSYDVSGNFADIDVGDTLTYSLAPGAPAWLSINAATGELTGTPDNADIGTSSITVIADDGNGGTVQDTFDITVNNTNEAPTVTPISDTSVNEDSALNYDVSGQFADADVGDVLTFSLAPGAPAWVSIDANTGVLTGTPDNGDVGTSSITVIADDGNGETVQDTFDVTVNNTNDAPTVTPISDTAVNEDAGLNYDVSGQFADMDVGDTLTYSLAPGAPAWVSIDVNTGILTGTPDNGDVGVNTITVIADDGNGETVQDTFDVTVNNTNDAPTVTPISDTSVNEDAGLNYDVSGQFADMDVGDTLTYSLAPGAPAWVSIDVNTGVLTGTPDNGDVGTSSITVIADDGNGGTVQDTFDVTVNNTNDAPTVTPISDTSVNEDAGLNYDVSGQFADADVGDVLTFSLAPGAPAWVSIDANTGILTGTPLNADVGVNTITVIADDGNGGTVQDTFDVTVNNTNDAPTVTPISDTAVNEDASLNYDVSGQFADMDVGDTLTYSLAPGAPAWVSIDVNTGILTGTPLNADVGVNTITVIADDGNGGTVQDTFDVTVNNTNDAPTVTPISDTSVNEDAGLNYDVSGQFADMDVGDTLTYSLAPGAPAWVSIDANTGILTGTPLNADVGVNTITVIADDGNGGTVQDTFDVTVNNTNDAPTVTPISDTAVNEDAGLNYDVSGQFTDMDVGDTLTYSLAPGAPAWVSIDVNTGILTGTPDNGDVGTSSITVIADDGNGGTVQDTFDVTVNNTNDAPTVTPISDTAVNEDAGLNYDVSGQFADMDVGDTLTYSLAPGAPGWVSIDVNTGILTGTPLNADVGVNTITVIADDGNGGTVQDTFDVTVNNTNDAPTVTPISDTAVNEDAGLNYDVSGQFADMDVGDTLTYSLAPGAPAWVSIDVNTGILTGTPLNADVGVNTITVIADDGNGGTVQDTFDVTVNNTNDAPTVTPISDTAVNEDAGLNYDVSGQFTDMDVGDTLTYSLAPGAPAWVSIDANTGILTGTPLNADVGVNTITVIADDGNGGTVQETFDVTVNNTNDAPTVSSQIADMNLVEGTPVSYDASSNFTDMDAGDSLTYTATLGDGSPLPSWLSIDTNTGELSGTPDDAARFLDIKVTATDGSSESVSDTFQMEIRPMDYGETVASHNPIMHLQLDETSGTTATDTAGSHDGTYTNGVVLGSEGGVDSGNSASFDGSNDYVEIAHHSDFALTEGSVNVMFNADTVSGDRTLFSRDSSGYDAGGHINAKIVNGQIQIRLQSADTTYTITGGSVTAGSWHQVTVTFGSEGFNLYVDGVLEATNAYTGGIDGNSEPWTLGAGQMVSGNGVATPLQEYFDGQIDEFSVMGDQLTADEIAELHEAGGSTTSTGTTGDDILSGQAGNDSIFGDQTTDLTSGAGGADTVYGNEGNDIISGDAGDDVEGAGTLGGNDKLYGGGGEDIIYGDAVDDIKLGGIGGDDLIEGGTGDDVIYGDAGGVIDATSSGGDDTIFGGAGADTMYGDAGGADNGNGGDDFIAGGAGADVGYGGSGNDSLYGDNTSDMSSGAGESDTLYGGEGSDRIFGDVGDTDGYGDMTNSTGGDDTLIGDAGNDYIYGDAHNRLINSTGGADYIDGGAGDDFLIGDSGDELQNNSVGGADTILGGEGDDKIYGDAGWEDVSSNNWGQIQNSQGGADSLYGGAGADTIYGDAHDDIMSGGSGGNDYIEGGAGNDIIYGDAGVDIHSDSSGGDDSILGGDGADTIYGDAGGNDNGNGGNDYLDGGSGVDLLYGGSGDDTIVYDAADSVIDGGAGNDILKVFDANVDLTGFGAVNFEEINLDEALTNNLQLNAQTVLDMSVGDELTISGDSTDSLQLDGSWAQGASVGGFTEYTSGAATVQVDDDIVGGGGVTIVP